MSRVDSVAASRALKWGIVALVGAAIVLRVILLDSDGYGRLTWSSAILTDEGFYIHNARNQVLFGRTVTDQFNNYVIMPLLHALQLVVFRTFGVSAVSARSISVVLGIGAIPAFWVGLRTAFGVRTAWLGALALALDHVTLLYSRLALMDTPAAFVMVCSFTAMMLSMRPGRTLKSAAALALCSGLLLVVAYGVRGLSLILIAAPPAAIWAVRRRPALAARAAAGAGAGVATGLLLFAILWAIPHRAEMARLNHYYISHQLLPHSPHQLRWNLTVALISEQRGVLLYLARHSPVQLIGSVLVLSALALAKVRSRAEPDVARAGEWYLAAWFVSYLLFCSFVNYSPSRYYVLFYPAMCGLAGHAFAHPGRFIAPFVSRTYKAALITGAAAYYLIAPYVRPSGLSETTLCIAGSAALAACMLVGSTRLSRSPRYLTIVAVTVFLAINTLWITDWLMHVSYRQRNADAWLAATLPPDSVLFGAIAPGLCLNNRFQCVNVMEGLCNDTAPLEKYPGRPRYAVILVGKWKERWWSHHYPEIMSDRSYVREFRGLLRPFFVIHVYRDDNSRRR